MRSLTETCAATPLVSGNDHWVMDKYLKASTNNNSESWIPGLTTDSSATRARLYSLSKEHDWMAWHGKNMAMCV